MAKVIRITSKVEGFRRAGIAHPTKPVDHPAEKFTPTQIDQLKREPMLVVQELDASKTGKQADDK